MATTGAANTYVLNIVELQNIVTTASGLTPVATLSNTVANIQKMVIFDEKRIAVNTISKYNTSPIQVVDSMNFASNATLSVNSNTVVLSGSSTTTTANYGAVSSIGYAGNYTNYFSTFLPTDTATAIQVGTKSVLTIDASGDTTITGGLRISGAGVPTPGFYLTCMDSLGTAQWQPFAQVSDQRWKTDIVPIADYQTILDSIRGVRFRWSDAHTKDIGLIAQDILPVLPEAVIEGVDGGPYLVQYNKIIPVLVEAMKAMSERVKLLEEEVLALQRP